MPQELEKAVDAVPPHPRRHRILRSQAFQRRTCRRVLRCQKEVVMFVEEGSVKGDKSLPLLVIQTIVVRVLLAVLHIIDLDTFALDHDKTSINYDWLVPV